MTEPVPKHEPFPWGGWLILLIVAAAVTARCVARQDDHYTGPEDACGGHVPVTIGDSMVIGCR